MSSSDLHERPRSRWTAPLLPFSPLTGWAEADRRPRILAAATVPLHVGAAASAVGYDAPAWWPLPLLVVVAAGPVTTYEAARILRPYRRGGASDAVRMRHGLAAIAASYGVFMVLVCLVEVVGQDWLDEDWWVGDVQEANVAFVCGLPALALAAITLLWGVIQYVVRVWRNAE